MYVGFVENQFFIMSNYIFTYSMSNYINLILFDLFVCTPTMIQKEKNGYTIGTDGKRIEDTG